MNKKVFVASLILTATLVTNACAAPTTVEATPMILNLDSSPCSITDNGILLGDTQFTLDSNSPYSIETSGFEHLGTYCFRYNGEEPRWASNDYIIEPGDWVSGGGDQQDFNRHLIFRVNKEERTFSIIGSIAKEDYDRLLEFLSK